MYKASLPPAKISKYPKFGKLCMERPSPMYAHCPLQRIGQFYSGDFVNGWWCAAVVVCHWALLSLAMISHYGEGRGAWWRSGTDEGPESP